MHYVDYMVNMISAIRGAVSKNKRRFQDGDFDLDLTYIKQNLIAMGFPAEKLEGVYRNPIDDVVRFLERKHKDHYKVYNLCSERKYDPSKFHNRVANYPFDDHNPPRIELIQPFCEDVDSWLAKHGDNVAVIHCKAGKGRTGVMICAYLLHRKVKQDAADALKFYDETRTSDHKGVTIPSQRRYVGYYDQLLKDKHKPEPEIYRERLLFLKGIKLTSLPHHTNLAPQIVIWKSSSEMHTKIYESLPITSASRYEEEICLEFHEKIPVSGDTLITVFNKPLIKLKKERLFQFWFNTYFVRDEGSKVATNGTSDLLCKMTDNPKNTGEPAKVKSNRIRTSDSTEALIPSQIHVSRISKTYSANQTDTPKHCVRAAQSFTFDGSRCLVLALNKSELDKANKDRSHKMFDANFKVVCYFEEEAKPVYNVGSMSEPSMSVEYESEDDLSDTDTECEDNVPHTRPT